MCGVDFIRKITHPGEIFCLLPTSHDGPSGSRTAKKADEIAAPCMSGKEHS
jgi:hypothetical protein